MKNKTLKQIMGDREGLIMIEVLDHSFEARVEILKERRRKGVESYLVKRPGPNEPDWIPADHVAEIRRIGRSESLRTKGPLTESEQFEYQFFFKMWTDHQKGPERLTAEQVARFSVLSARLAESQRTLVREGLA